ncbi:MAG: peptidase, partial [Acidimicrobiia bacterium]|nr:peptidase [Acidimicrobiia bacterium]
MSSGYNRYPSIHSDLVVFVAEDDLWTVPREGGIASRLVTNPGPVSYPCLSPDGSEIAYTGVHEGVTEVYVVATEGGRPIRLTYQGADSRVVGWLDPDTVVFSSNADLAFVKDRRLWTVGAEGGTPVGLPWGPAEAVARQPGGTGMVLGRHSDDPARWKRYRGGRAGNLWIGDEEKGGFGRLIDLQGNLADPMWIGDRIFFISDHEGHGNIYSVDTEGKDLTTLTDHEDFYVRMASTDGHHIVYTCGADVWLVDPETGDGGRIDVVMRTSRASLERRFILPGKYLAETALHPQGHSLAASVRGEVATMPLWEGAVRHHRQEADERRRLPVWLADGERLVSITDSMGEDAIIIDHPDGASDIVEGDLGRIRTMDPAPAGLPRVVITNNRHQVLLVDLEDGSVREVDASSHSWIAGTTWSGDGHWLAYSKAVSALSSSLFLFDTRDLESEPVQITDSVFHDWGPSFDPDGRYLYFLSSRDFNPVADTHFHDYGFPTGVRPHLVTLRPDLVSPFDPVQRSPRPPGAPNDKTDTNRNTKADVGDSVGDLEIDTDGIAQRIVAFPLPPGRYRRVVGAKDRVFSVVVPVEEPVPAGDDEELPPRGRLQAWDFNTEKIETVMDGVSDVAATSGGRTIQIRAKSKVRVVQAGWKADGGNDSGTGRQSGWVDIDRIRVEIDQPGEWRQMFSEAWRLQRDHFWFPEMAGVDWRAVHEYLPLVDRVTTRSELSDLLWEMQGELGTSHAYEMGGDYLPVPSYPVGHLGARLEPMATGWKVTGFLDGDPWNPDVSSPLADPGVDIELGDRIVSIDGMEVNQSNPTGKALVDKGGRAVTLTIRRGRRRPHRVVTRTLKSEQMLRYRDWVTKNHRYVAESTDGRVGYIHIPDMQLWGFGEFHRGLSTEIDHEGLVVDVRYNRGGNVSQLLLQKLLRERRGWVVSRWRE